MEVSLLIESLLLAKIVKLTNFDYEKEPSLSPVERERIRTGVRSLEFYDPNYGNTQEAASENRLNTAVPVQAGKSRKA